MQSATPELSFPRHRIVLWMAITVITLTVLHLMALYVRLYTQHDASEYLTFIIYIFNTEAEWNLPAFYSAGAILFASVLLFVTACCVRATGRPDRGFWFGLSFLFLYMATDELCRIHERFNVFVPTIMESLGMALPDWVRWSWVIPFALAALIIGAIYLRFLWRLPVRTRVLFMLSGGIYLGGAMGMELVAMLIKRNTPFSFAELMASTTEEFMEMSGIVLFVYSIMDYLSSTFGRIAVTIAPVAALPLALHEVAEPSPQAHGVAA